ncbi:MAG: M28 family peptidase [Ignavibacteriae bacterium]|nr:M28 family peptidase [Ignavibacteriota bacterium]
MKKKNLIFVFPVFILCSLFLVLQSGEQKNSQFSLFGKNISLNEPETKNIFFIKNSIPAVSNIQTTLMSSINAVKITYNLYDADSDPMRITLRLSSDSGKTYLFPCDSVTGDVGYPVYSGNQKQIFWFYSATPFILKAKIIADDMQVVDISAIVNQVDSNKLKDNLFFIQGIRHRTAGISQLQKVMDSILTRFLRYNLQTSIQNWDYSGYNAQNFLGRLPGTTNEDTTYIIDGHFETVGNSPGADDNGTGVAAFLEIARILSNYNFSNTIKFIGFDLEESGMLGSQKYVAEGIPSYEKIAGVFNFDMIGYFCDVPNCQSLPTGTCTLFPDLCDSAAAQQYKGNFILNVANVNSNSLRNHFDSCARLYVPQLRVLSLAVQGNGQIAPFLRRSDHASFWDAGFKALLLNDGGGESRNHNYHTPGDTIGTLNMQFLTNVVKTTIASVTSIAEVRHSGYATGNFFTVGINQINSEIPDRYELFQNYPNPFNPSTNIKYQIANNSYTTIKIYNMLGKEITTLVNEKLQPGIYEVNFDGSNLPSGIYFYQLKTDYFIQTKKLILLK